MFAKVTVFIFEVEGAELQFNSHVPAPSPRAESTVCNARRTGWSLQPFLLMVDHYLYSGCWGELASVFLKEWILRNKLVKQGWLAVALSPWGGCLTLGRPHPPWQNHQKPGPRLLKGTCSHQASPDEWGGQGVIVWTDLGLCLTKGVNVQNSENRKTHFSLCICLFPFKALFLSLKNCLGRWRAWAYLCFMHRLLWKWV